MILGVGADVADVKRIAAALSHPTRGERFRAKVFTPTEIAYCEQRRHAPQNYAARFAAKEATMKALGSFVPWRDVEVVRDGHGPPRLHLHGRAAERARQLGIARWWLTLTHTSDLALAWVVAER